MLAIGSLLLAAGCALWILQDILRGHAQPMKITNVVWPLNALYAEPLQLRPQQRQSRRPLQALVGPEHLVVGHALRQRLYLGDILAGSLLIVLPLAWFGNELLTSWILDYIFAFVLGIAFQYFTIRPMSDKSPRQALMVAIKADTLSLTAWQAGMYGWMAIATFLIFGHSLDKTGPVFWLTMQVAMLAGFVTTWPVDAWLIRAGIKARM